MAVSILDPAHPDLIGLYTCDAFDTGTGKLICSGGSLADGTPYSASIVPGPMSNAVRVGPVRSTSHVLVPVSSNPDIRGISLWMKLNSATIAWRSGLCLYGGSNINRFIILISDSTVRRISLYGPARTIIAADQDAPVGVWFNVIAYYDGTYTRLVIDGMEQGQKLTGNMLNVGTIQKIIFGNHQYNTSIVNSGDVDIDQVRFFGRGFTAGEIQELNEEPWPYEVKGTVTKDGSPLSTQVRLYNAASGELLHTLNTDANGAYQKVLSSADPIYAMAIGPNGYRPLVHGPINPALRNPS